MALPKIVQQTARGIAGIPVAGPLLRSLAGGKLHLRFRFRHPIDAYYGVDTSGYVDKEKLVADRKLAQQISPYMGIQPSVVRRALKTLPASILKNYGFVDLGCGKGRVMTLASEFPFQHITGVEISELLAKVGRRNADIILTKYPERTPINIITGNAVDFPVTSRHMVLFIYNSFGPQLMAELLKNIEIRLEDGALEHLFLIYHNPVSGHVFDKSKALKRWFACHLPAEPAEKDFGVPRESVTLIWQSVKNTLPGTHADAGRQVAITTNGQNTVFKEEA